MFLHLLLHSCLFLARSLGSSRSRSRRSGGSLRGSSWPSSARLRASSSRSCSSALVDGPLASRATAGDLVGRRRRARARRRRGRSHLPAPPLRAPPHDTRSSSRACADVLRAPAAPPRRFPRSLAVGAAPQPRVMQDIGLIRRWLTFGLIMLVVNVLTMLIGIGATVPLALGARNRLLHLLAARSGSSATSSRSSTARFRGRARTSRATSRRPSRRACTASACSRPSAAAGTRSRSSARRPSRCAAPRCTRPATWQSSGSGTTSCRPRARRVPVHRHLCSPQRASSPSASCSAFFALAAAARWPMNSLGFLFSFIIDTRTATDRVFEVFDAEITITDPEHPRTIEQPRGELAFRDVHFRFPMRATTSATSSTALDSRAQAGGNDGTRRRDRLGQDDPHRAPDKAVRRDRGRGASSTGSTCATSRSRNSAGASGRVRGSDPLLGERARERAARPRRPRPRAGQRPIACSARRSTSRRLASSSNSPTASTPRSARRA